MANSPREFQDRSTQLQSTPSFLTSPTSCVNSNISSIVTSSDGNGIYHHHHNHHHSNPSTPRTPTGQTITRSEPTNNPYPTTFVQADTNSFKQVVQMLTGSTITTKHPSSQSTPDLNPSSSHPPRNHHHHHQIPPIKPVSKPKPSRLLERRNSQKSLRLTPLIPSTSTPNHHHLSPRHYPPPELLSPSILDFPSLILSPVTPLIHDPFNRSSSSSYPGLTRCAPQTSLTADRLAEEKAIAEKGFYLHRSPATTPRGSSEPPPRLLPLFPLTSPKVSGCSSDD